MEEGEDQVPSKRGDLHEDEPYLVMPRWTYEVEKEKGALMEEEGTKVEGSGEKRGYQDEEWLEQQRE